jgi:hypothetical protein
MGRFVFPRLVKGGLGGGQKASAMGAPESLGIHSCTVTDGVVNRGFYTPLHFGFD